MDHSKRIPTADTSSQPSLWDYTVGYPRGHPSIEKVSVYSTPQASSGNSIQRQSRAFKARHSRSYQSQGMHYHKIKHFERRSPLNKSTIKRERVCFKSNATHTNASQKPNGNVENVYINAPKATATRIGARANSVFCGGFSIAAPDPIAVVVNIYWKVMSVELKQLSRVTSWISGSSTSAKTMSTHYSS